MIRSSISSLKDLSHLTHLRELYLRKNQISDLHELLYLQELPYLSVLWLDENPIASLPDYRTLVLSILPKLQRLDDKDVTPDEISRALQKPMLNGVELERLSKQSPLGSPEEVHFPIMYPSHSQPCQPTFQPLFLEDFLKATYFFPLRQIELDALDYYC